MRAVEPWVEGPLAAFVQEAAARVTLLMTSDGQVVAQHGFTRSLDVMAAAALGAGIVASTRELAREIGGGERGFGEVVHQGSSIGVFLAPFDLPHAHWIGLVVFGPDSSLGLVRLFFRELVAQLARAAPDRPPVPVVLPESFEDELNASLRALFSR
jgi:predicted regulator of Ras-like GTPase activity (Roadblock/LC7/MglB family)